MAQRLDGSGTVLTTQTFDAYGARQSTDGNSDPYAGFGGQVGYYTDWETGTAASALELLTFRYYDPSAGRFLNRDPLGHGGGANEYEYVNNGPVGNTDSSGLEPGILGFIGAFESAAGACLGAYIGTGTGQDYDPCYANYNNCLRWVECVADAVSAFIGGFASIYAVALEPLIGCLEGVISGYLHQLGEYICSKANPCHPSDQSKKCQGIAFAMDIAFGCLDGIISSISDEEVAKLAIGFLFETVAAGISNGYEASDCFHSE